MKNEELRTKNVARRVRSGASVFFEMLREIFDEAAYARFLERNGVSRSRESYAAFARENGCRRERRARCC